MKTALTGHMNFFDVKKCGLYEFGDGDDVASRGIDLSETLNLIAEWVRTVDFEDTIPWDPEKSPDTLHDCYCHDLYVADDEIGDFVLVLWKSDKESKGNIWGRAKNSPFGNLSIVERNNKDKKTKIWGRPCYYWFLPSINIVISIKFENSVCDTALMQEWIERAITHRIKHPKKTKSKTPSGQVRFQFDDAAEDAKFIYNFKARIKSVDTSNAEFSKMAEKVTHIVKRDTMVIAKVKSEASAWVRAIGSKIAEPQDNAKSREVEVRIQARPTAAQLKEIVEAFSSENRKKGDWDNVGFTVDNQVIWADTYRLHDHIILNANKSHVVGAAELYEKLLPQRAKLINMIDKAETKSKKVA